MTSINRTKAAALLVLLSALTAFHFSRQPERGPAGHVANTDPGKTQVHHSTGANAGQPDPEHPPSIPTKSAAKERLNLALANLKNASSAADSRKILDDLRSYLDSLPPGLAAEVITGFLANPSNNAPTHIEFAIGQSGYLDGHPSLRIALLDWLGEIDPQQAGVVAAQILSTPTDADEWAISLRNYANAYQTTEGNAFLRSKTEEMLRNPAWRANPSIGFFESFDVLVHTRATGSTPLLSDLVADRTPEGKPLAHASFLTLDRLTLREPAAMMEQLAARPDLTQARGEMVANLFARADIADPTQQQLVRNYLLDPARTATELSAFAGVFPNANFTISKNLLSENLTQTRDEITTRDAAALQVVDSWLADPAFATVVQFTGNGASNKGSDPRAGVVLASDGNFYGTTRAGGDLNLGTIFRMSPSGMLETLVMFSGSEPNFRGADPRSGLIQGSDGNLYGTTRTGGNFNQGTVFRMSLLGEFTTLAEFGSGSPGLDGNHPQGALVQGIDGNLYGTTREGGPGNVGFGFGTIFRVTPGGSVATVIRFTGTGISSKGKRPYASLTVGPGGFFYGTTYSGGATDNGTVFRTKTGADLVSVVEFTGTAGANKGSAILSRLAAGDDGLLYGTTSFGGTSNFGTVFKMTPEGALTTLKEFDGVAPLRGRYPSAGLIKNTDGNFYGTTGQGGSGFGTVFKMTPGGAFTNLIEFTGNGALNKGDSPYADLLNLPDGTLYGTTVSGGSSNMGTIFKLATDGTLTTLVQFTGNGVSNKGAKIYSALVQGSDGSLYGTARNGGAADLGTVFKMTPLGELTTLIEFTGNGATNKGAYPETSLVLAADGNFYGTTTSGGASNFGTVFKMTPQGALTTLVEFTTLSEGYPEAPLIADTDGNLYGVTHGPDGSIYRLLFPGRPLLETPFQPALGVSIAQLAVQVNPRGLTTSVVLEYGTDGIVFSNTVPIAPGLFGFASRIAGTTLSNLSIGTTYHYRFRATNSAGTTLSPVKNFSTLAAPLATVTPPSAVLPTSSQLNGTVNARNYDASVIFQWGSDGNNFPNQIPAVPATITGSAAGPVSAAVAGLTKGVTYYYRVVATNTGGTAVSGVQAFTTLTEPIAITGEASALSTTRAQVMGTVDPKGSSADVSFEYGTDGIDFPNSLSAAPASVSGSELVPVTATLTGLQQGTTYFYRIRATGPGGTGLSAARTFSLSILSGLVRVFPDPPPLANGTVTVNFDPPTRGAWRFAGETAWRNSGVAATNLASGQRLIEFLPIAGYIPPPVESLDVTSSGSLVLDRFYFETETIGSGGLTVHLKPEDLAAAGVPVATRAQWRFVGESLWRDGDGPPVSSLTAGSYLVECKPVTGKVTPSTASITITKGSSSELTLTYFTANNTGGSTPLPLPFSSVSADEDLPFAYVGQIRSEVGSSTGFVVKRRVVATAGHVVFDDGSLSYITSLQWLFQQHSGQFEPKPQVPRGSYLATGYATQRIADNRPGEGSPQSQTLDYAALYFLEEAGRGGYGGFLATDAGDDNEFLTSTSQKIFAGYAVDGIPAADKGKLHATTAFTAPLTPAFGETWISTAVRGYGGCSGGPLFVQRPNGLYFPAAIYLGGNGQTVVRAIDSAVVDLFLRAEVSGNGGDNNTGGGITHSSFSAIGANTQPGALEVTIQPAAARNAGAGWRLKPESSYRSSGSQKSGLSAGDYRLQLSPVSGFLDPTQQTVTVNGGQLQQVTFTYAAANAAPTIGNVANLTIDEDTSSGSISVTVDDPDGPNNALVLTGTSSNISLVPNGNIVFSGSGGSRFVTIMPAANQTGSATITLTVSDGDLTDTDTFVITVDPVNDTPTFTSIAAQLIPVNTSPGIDLLHHRRHRDIPIVTHPDAQHFEHHPCPALRHRLRRQRREPQRHRHPGSEPAWQLQHHGGGK